MFVPSTPGMGTGNLDPRLENLLSLMHSGSGGQQSQGFHPSDGSDSNNSGLNAHDMFANNQFQKVMAAGMNNDGGFADKTRMGIANMTPLLIQAYKKYQQNKAGGGTGAPVPTSGGSPMPGYGGGDNEQTEAPTGQQPMPGYGQQPDPQLAAIMAQLGKGGMLS